MKGHFTNHLREAHCDMLSCTFDSTAPLNSLIANNTNPLCSSLRFFGEKTSAWQALGFVKPTFLHEAQRNVKKGGCHAEARQGVSGPGSRTSAAKGGNAGLALLHAPSSPLVLHFCMHQVLHRGKAANPYGRRIASPPQNRLSCALSRSCTVGAVFWARGRAKSSRANF